MSVPTKYAARKNPFSGLSTSDLSLATEEIMDIVDGLSDLAAPYTDATKPIKKAKDLRKAENIRLALQLCQTYQRYLSKEVDNRIFEAETKEPELTRIEHLCAQSSRTIAEEIDELNEGLAEYRDRNLSSRPMILRLSDVCLGSGLVYITEMYLMFGDVLTKPFNDSLFAKALFSGASGGVAYLSFKDKIDPFFQAAAEAVFGKDPTITAPYAETVSRLNALTTPSIKKDPANDVPRPNNYQERVARTGIDL